LGIMPETGIQINVEKNDLISSKIFSFIHTGFYACCGKITADLSVISTLE